MNQTPQAAALRISQVAATLRVSEYHVRQWADAGELPSFKTLTGHRRFLPEDVDAFAAKLAAQRAS